MFGKKRNQSGVEDDVISDDLLNALPELEAREAPSASDDDDAPFIAAAPIQAPAPIAAPAPARAPKAEKKFVPVDPAPAAATADVHDLIIGVRREMESVFVKELDRVEGSFSSLITQMEQRLKAANDQLAHLEQERASLEQANAQYSRKFAALKQITEDP